MSTEQLNKEQEASHAPARLTRPPPACRSLGAAKGTLSPVADGGESQGEGAPVNNHRDMSCNTCRPTLENNDDARDRVPWDKAVTDSEPEPKPDANEKDREGRCWQAIESIALVAGEGAVMLHTVSLLSAVCSAALTAFGPPVKAQKTNVYYSGFAAMQDLDDWTFSGP